MHVAIILDGNRRYAKKMGLDPLKGHEQGAKKVSEILSWLKELEIREITFYTLSTENLKRTPPEIFALMELFGHFLDKTLNEPKIKEHEVKVRFLGKLELLEPEIVKKMQKLMDKTASHSKYIVNFCVAYGGRAEIVDACRKLKEKNLEITEENITQNLYQTNEPDIFIRPGGEKRLSNFLLWQLSYTELFFLEKLLPEITKQDLAGILEEFKHRERRKGI